MKGHEKGENLGKGNGLTQVDPDSVNLAGFLERLKALRIPKRALAFAVGLHDSTIHRFLEDEETFQRFLRRERKARRLVRMVYEDPGLAVLELRKHKVALALERVGFLQEDAWQLTEYLVRALEHDPALAKVRLPLPPEEGSTENKAD